MGFGYLIAGFLFFFLPNFNIIDILPDFVGCLFIIKGLSKLADLTPGLYDAKNAFVKVTYLYIVKFLLMFTVPFFGSTNDGGYILIFNFVFVVLDFIFTLPAFKTLLNGFVYLGDRTNSSVVFNKQSEFSTLTSIFIGVRAILALLPDLSFISSPDYSGTVSNDSGFYLSNYKTLLVGVNFVITGILGLVWVIFACRYFYSIKKDTNLIAYLEEKYNTDIMTNKGLFIRRSVKTAFLFVVIGSLLNFDLLIDNVNVLPDFLGVLMFGISALVLRKYVNVEKYLIASVVSFVFSIVSWVMLVVYSIKFPAVNIWANFEAYELFNWVNVANVVKYISFIFLFISFYFVIKNIMQKFLNENTKFNVIRRQNITCLVFGVIVCLSGVVRMYLLYDYGIYVVVDFVINILWFGFVSKLVSTVNECVEYKYL